MLTQDSPNSPNAPSNLDGRAPPEQGQSADTRHPLQRLAEALEAEKAAAVPSTEAPAPTGSKKTAPKDFAKLAETLGVEAADLYKIEVPSSRDGEKPYTLGQLKDWAKERDDFAVRSLQLEDDARKRESEFLRAESELQELFAALPKDAIKPEARAALQAKRDAALTKERQRVLEAIPEWQDAAVRTQEIESIIEHLKDYGFPDSYITQVFDHRTLRYIRANWRRETQVRKALEGVTERKAATPPKSKPASNAPRRPVGNGMVTPEAKRVQGFIDLINQHSR